MKKLNLIPDMFEEAICDISINTLLEQNISAVIIDLDNTITEWNSYELMDENRKWLELLKANHIKICIVSNNDLARVERVAIELDIPFIHKAYKPRRKSFIKAMELLGSHAKNTAVIGDQLFTDVLGGKRLGLFTILVNPINPREFIGTRFTRKIEKLICNKAKIRSKNNRLKHHD
jgi:HAD superfamily phosphatase (TIGR01668 family)